MDENNEFQKRRKRLLDASESPRTKIEIEDALKKNFKGKRLNLVVDDRTWNLSIEFDAVIRDPNNNKAQQVIETELNNCGSLYMPLSDIMNQAAWLIANVGMVRKGGLGGDIRRRANG